jgi:hypothetical protein
LCGFKNELVHYIVVVKWPKTARMIEWNINNSLIML